LRERIGEAEFARLLGDPAPVRVGAEAGEVDSSALDLDAVYPPPSHQITMPAQQGLRRDEQAMAAIGWEQSACRGKEGTVSGSQPWALDLAAQHSELMAQHDQLEVLGLGGPAATHQQP
jgi:hypothetical protein